jgi:nitrite reductase/ring-hydroxylating ferredoxin subunit
MKNPLPETPGEQALCRLEDIPDGGARGFLPNVDREDRVFAVRRGNAIHAWVNCCPHNRRPLDWAKDKFLDRPGGEIVCFAHGAHFDVASGECVAGVCLGDRLTPVPVRVVDGAVLVPVDLPAVEQE